jgi:hypothetical protein
VSKRCELDSDDVASLEDTDFRDVPYTEGCVVEAGSRFRLINPLKDEEAMPTPEHDAVEQPHEAPHEPVVEQHEEPVMPPQAPEPAPQPVLHEQVGADAGPQVADLSQLQGLAGDNPMVMLALAGIAVLGGSAGWKHWNKLSEQKHEQKMKELEMQANAQGMNGAQPPPCQAANLKMEAELKALQAHLAEVAEKAAKAEKRTMALASSDFDPEEWEKWKVKVDNKLKNH